MIIESAEIEIPDSELEFSYSRSSGKGGQNVNKVSSKAQLKWNVLHSTSLRQDIKDRFLKKYQNRLTTAGEILIQSERHRSQGMNADDCVAKLKEMILSVEKPPKIRKKTKPSKSQKKKRLESKRAHSDKKANRRVKY